MKKLFLLLMLAPALAWAGNYGSSIEGKDANVTFVHTSAIDSAHFVFAYPDTSNWYDSVFTYPVAWGSSKILNGAGLDLDSVGVHIIKVRYYSGGTIAGHTAGVWLHEADSVYHAITDVNKPNFHSSGDTIQRNASVFDASADSVMTSNPPAYKADVSELSTFDPASDVVVRVTFVDSTDTVIKASAASIDYGRMADTVWTHAVRTLTSGTGTGSNQVIIRTKSSLDSAVIPGASIAVWNADQSALMGLLSSDTDSGKAVFALDNGTYNLRIQKYKFQWTVPITIGVSGNKDTTVYATEFTPTSPPSSDLCTVYGYMDSLGLVGDRAEISCTIHEQGLRIGTKILAYYSYTKTVYTNTSGYWEMFLPPNAIITPSGSEYEFEIKAPYQSVLKKWVTVPELVSWEFTW